MKITNKYLTNIWHSFIFTSIFLIIHIECTRGDPVVATPEVIHSQVKTEVGMYRLILADCKPRPVSAYLLDTNIFKQVIYR